MENYSLDGILRLHVSRKKNEDFRYLKLNFKKIKLIPFYVLSNFRREYAVSEYGDVLVKKEEISLEDSLSGDVWDYFPIQKNKRGMCYFSIGEKKYRVDKVVLTLFKGNSYCSTGVKHLNNNLDDNSINNLVWR